MRYIARLGVMTLTVALPAAGATTLTVNGDANIFGAGHAIPPGPAGAGVGSLPPGVSFPAGRSQVLTLSDVTGCVTMTVAFGSCNGGDGSTAVLLSTSIDSYGGISGISHDTNGFLIGIFLGPDEPLDPAPPALDFRTPALGTSFPMLAPQLNQTFFVGDGFTGAGTGSVQQFAVPPTATRFYLGYADGQSYSGVPGAYGDNGGSLTATFDIACSGSAPADIGNTLRGVRDAALDPVLTWSDLGADEADYHVYRGGAPDPIASPPQAIGTSGGPDAVAYVDGSAPAAPGCAYYKVRGIGPCGDEIATW